MNFFKIVLFCNFCILLTITTNNSFYKPHVKFCMQWSIIKDCKIAGSNPHGVGLRPFLFTVSLWVQTCGFRSIIKQHMLVFFNVKFILVGSDKSLGGSSSGLARAHTLTSQTYCHPHI